MVRANQSTSQSGRGSSAPGVVAVHLENISDLFFEPETYDPFAKHTIAGSTRDRLSRLANPQGARPRDHGHPD